MNRRLTNIIRFFMDECLPPIIRDSKLFMYPFFLYAYRGKQVGTAMNFKRQVSSMSKEEYLTFYHGLDTISRNRKSDLNEPSIRHILKNIDPTATSLLDVGCGRGYLLSRLDSMNMRLTGCDAVSKMDLADCAFVEGDVCELPFGNEEFDVVCCCHTLEHIVDLPRAIEELCRVARKQVMVVVPCQRPYLYTLDEHVHFFTYPEQLTSLFYFEQAQCEKIWGDWVYIGSKRASSKLTSQPTFRNVG